MVFLKRLIEELNKIKRLDLVLKILSDPDIKRLINRHPTTPLISRVTDDEQSNGHLSLARKSRKCTCVFVDDGNISASFSDIDHI